MIDTSNNLLSLAEKNREHLSTLSERIFAAARPDAVYSAPVVSGNYTIVTASEVTAGGGFGFGGGLGGRSTPSSTKEQPEEVRSQSEQLDSGGGGLGGGGGSSGRPVAVIVIGPDGVTVKPVFDAT